MKRAVFGELEQNLTSSEGLSHDSKGKNGLEVKMMFSSQIQKSRGSENKRSMLMSMTPSAKEVVAKLQLAESTTGNFKRVETTNDASKDIKRPSSLDKRSRSSLAGTLSATANAAQLNQTMLQIPSQQEDRLTMTRAVLDKKGGSPARSQRSASFDDRSGAHPFSVNESDLIVLGNDYDSA